MEKQRKGEAGREVFFPSLFHCLSVNFSPPTAALVGTKF